MARKGKPDSNRQHRYATIISVSDDPKPVRLRQLKKFAPEPISKHSIEKSGTPSTGGFLDVRAYLEHYGKTIVAEKPYGSAALYVLEHCLFNPKHGHKEAAIGQSKDGVLFYYCFHNTCKPRTWREARN